MPYIGAGIQKFNTADGLTVNGNAEVTGTSALTGAATLTAGFTASDGCTITTADNSSQLTLVSTDADGSSGPHLVLQRDSSSPADNDLLGQIIFRGEDDGSNVVEACEMKVTARDVTNGTEDSQFDITTQVAGTARSRMVMNEVETVFNQDSVDVNFRIESDDLENMFFLNAGTNSVGVRHTSVPSNGVLYALDPAVSGSSAEKGWVFRNDAAIYHTTDNANQMYMNDTSTSSGLHNYILFRFQGSLIGDIDSSNNSTVRYNTFTGGHWCQFSDLSQPNLKVGTVLSSINEMCQWTEFEFADENGAVETTSIAGTFEIGSTHTIYIDEDGAQAQGTAVSHDTSQRVVKVKVSDVAGDRSVYGVFACHYKDGDSSVESLGLGVIRIGSGVTVANGDLLESAGDGTARPQTGTNADLYKAGTIAKVTSTVVVETYDDGSYTVPCTLHCG